MKAILQTRYGPPEVLQLLDLPAPVPRESQVLVKVVAASANALDWRPLTFPPSVLRVLGGGRSKPTDGSYGVDLAGSVESVGSRVTRFRPGDDVFGVGTGAFAEYACAEERKLALKPASVSFEAAAASPVAGSTALQSLRDRGRLQPGHEVLIHGASGGVGTFAVQIAKYFNARVTAVCSARNVEMIRSIGADAVIDYGKEDFARLPQRFDLVLAVNGSRPLSHYWRVLKPAGTCVVLGGSFAQIVPAFLFGPCLSAFASRTLRFMVASISEQDLTFLAGLIAEGKVVPVIDRRFGLAEVADAMRYLISEHPRGKVIIAMDEAGRQ
jgi:NADPH:quinone reductase-like Zn-dependent oxidoreductase